MKTLIIAVNSKYIHSALAPWYLKAACGTECGEVRVAEHTVNETYDDILISIYLHKPDIAAFSCYIWNISIVLRLAASLKKLLPHIVIILGGPEVSYDAGHILKEHAYIDYVLAGEGERSFPELIKRLKKLISNRPDMPPADIKQGGRKEINQGGEGEKGKEGAAGDAGGAEKIGGLAYRAGGVSRAGVCDIIVNAPAQVEVLDSIPSPYTDEMIMSLKNRIIYFEASRGCPFSCSYCLSSVSGGVRSFSLDRVFADLDRLAAAGVKQVKFVDRTFNSNKKRAAAIICHIMEMDRQASANCSGAAGKGGYPGSGCNFHFEVGADLFDEEILRLLESAPKGLFQIEAGVQTANEAALEAVCRKTDTGKLLSNLSRLRKSGRVHIHADLIAGLPGEDYASFGKSFDTLYAARPHQLQLGFLKFLKGTGMRERASHEGYQFNDFPPYEILSGRWVSYDGLIVLKGVAELVERYYNSGRFVFSLEYMIKNCFESAFRFFESFYFFHKENGYTKLHIGVKELSSIFGEFAFNSLSGAGLAEFRELLRLDFLASDPSGTLPDFMERRNEPGFNDQYFDFLKNTKQIMQIIPEASCTAAKQLFKKVHFERFRLDFAKPGGISQASGGGIRDGSGETPGAGALSGMDEPAGYDLQCETVLMFNYMARDKVTGRYPYYRVEIF